MNMTTYVCSYMLYTHLIVSPLGKELKSYLKKIIWLIIGWHNNVAALNRDTVFNITVASLAWMIFCLTWLHNTYTIIIQPSYLSKVTKKYVKLISAYSTNKHGKVPSYYSIDCRWKGLCVCHTSPKEMWHLCLSVHALSKGRKSRRKKGLEK